MEKTLLKLALLSISLQLAAGNKNNYGKKKKHKKNKKGEPDIILIVID